jgi:hypothetical protein
MSWCGESEFWISRSDPVTSKEKVTFLEVVRTLASLLVAIEV